MRKLSFPLLAAAMLMVLSCNKNASVNETNEPEITAATTRHCAADEVLQQQLQEDPGLAQRMADIERFTRQFISNVETGRLLSDGTMEIPVVVNVLYRTASENISDAQIQSQIDVLNADYAGTNAEYGSIPAAFTGVKAGDCRIRFVLQNTVRKQTNKRSWGTNDAMKKAAQGGINPTSPTTTLNIWVCTLSNGILGYAQFPGGNPATDGVVCLNTAFGTVGTVKAPFHKGRTATHEIGHYLNLRHIWGDASCGNDLVDDTPIHNSANYGCPSYPANSSCGGTVHPMMTMNYMDYTDDPCMYMFSTGQKLRMQATYATNGPRATLR